MPFPILRKGGQRGRQSPIVNRQSSILLVLLLAALSGCIRYDETITVDERGAGSAAVVVSRPDAGMGAAAAAAILDTRFSGRAMKDGLPAGLACQYTRTEAGGRVEIRAVYAFDTIDTLIGWAAHRDSPFSNLRVVRQDGALEFERSFARLRPEELAAVRDYLPDSRAVFRFTGPGTLETTNASRREGNSAVWDCSAADLFAGQTFTARCACASSWRWLLGVGLAVVLLLAALVVHRRRRSARQKGMTA